MAAAAKTRSVTAHVAVELAERVNEIAERLERSKPDHETSLARVSVTGISTQWPPP
jgi:predicted transcriptional regulator